jgi:hypothetical protein
MKKTFLWIIAYSFGLTANAWASPYRICFFSMNEEREFTTAQKFMERLNRVSPVKVEVSEFLSQGAKPEEAFRKMVESGVRCDGLVISGHHTGAYGGHRAAGRLRMDFMESLSCNPKYADWFRQVNAAWLQGCRTLGVGEIAADDDQYDADFHTNRVGQVLEEDGLEQNFSQLNMEFSNTLDQDNPLASRYLRLFPEARLFGWTRSAPGEKTGSWLSLLYHLAQTSRELDPNNQFPSRNLRMNDMSDREVANYAQGVLATLHRFQPEQRYCEGISVDGWLAHGNARNPNGRFFFDNSDLKALSSLASTGDRTLQEAQEIDCLLKNSSREKNERKLGEALDRLLANPNHLRYSFNTLVDMRNQLRRSNSPMARQILDRMKNHPEVISFLESKFRSRQVGILRKVDYYNFYRALTGRRDNVAENEIRQTGMKVLQQGLPSFNREAENPARSRNLAAAHRAEVFQSLLKNNLLQPNSFQELLQSNVDVDVLASMARHVATFDRANGQSHLRAIAASPRANRLTASAIMSGARALKLPPDTIAGWQLEMNNTLMLREPPTAESRQPANASGNPPPNGRSPAILPPPGSGAREPNRAPNQTDRGGRPMDLNPPRQEEPRPFNLFDIFRPRN